MYVSQNGADMTNVPQYKIINLLNPLKLENPQPSFPSISIFDKTRFFIKKKLALRINEIKRYSAINQ